MARNPLGEIRAVLSALQGSGNDRARQGELATTFGAFPAFDPSRLAHDFKRLVRGSEQAMSGVVMGPPLEELAVTVYPVFLLGLILSKDGELNCWVRVALFTEKKVEGWRFEPPDATSDRGHGFWHAQRIVGWHKNQAGFENLSAPVTQKQKAVEDDVFCIRPAFPLLCRSPAALVVAAIVSVYGTARTQGILEGYVARPLAIAREIEELVGAVP